ncbi:MAG: prepilin-type N-terminal cleavage/methylation domain-containing protein [Planctomycetota bacterium]|jgi:prepilin-type N-terminal cleavage/methylation domain-containing protein
MAEYNTMITERQTHHHANIYGFTLVEAMMAVMVLGIAAASVLLPFISGAAVRTEGVNRTLAARLASDLMEQILRLPFHDPNDETSYSLGPESGDFDNIDDYHGYTELQGQVKDANEVVFDDSNYAMFSRNVTCEYVYVPPQPAESDPEKCEFIRVIVQVSHNGKQMATVVRLVSE